jgi:P pilus assembly chaperone PapD
MSRTLKATLLASALALASATAFSATFSVFPLKVNLNAQQTTQILTIHNSGDQPLRLQVEGKNWGIGPDTGWVLGDTDDLILTPELLTVAANGDAILRVGSDSPAGDRELTYRLLITEIKDASAAPGNGARLDVKTQLSLPVFIEPATPIKPELAINAAKRADTQMLVTLENKGTQRTDAQAVSVNLLDASGKSLEKQDSTASYVLAGNKSELRLNVKPESCAATTQVQITFTNPVTTITGEVPAGAKACGKKAL